MTPRSTQLRQRRIIGLAAIVPIAALPPLILSNFTLGLVGEWLPLVLLAISIDLLWGGNRIISFGHGAFFAGGGYIAGLLLHGPQSNATSVNYALLGGNSAKSTFATVIDALGSVEIAGVPILALVLPIIICGIFGLIVGAIVFRLGSVEIYAPLITLAAGVLAQTIFTNLSVVGASNGLSGIPSFTERLAHGSNSSVYYFNGAFLVVVFVGYAVFCGSRAGSRWRASGDDPIRLEALGTDVYRLRTLGFGASAALAGLAGALYVGAYGFMSPNTASVTFSLQALIWVAVGGPGALLAPVVGTLAIQTGQQYLSNGVTSGWELLLGGLLIVLVLVAPGGITSLAKSATATAVARRPTRLNNAWFRRALGGGRRVP